MRVNTATGSGSKWHNGYAVGAGLEYAFTDNISAKAEYACAAMLELATQHGQPKPVRIQSIADTTGISSRFLVQILLQLKGAGLVASVRGALGGYQLVRAPDKVSLADIVYTIDRAPAAPQIASRYRGSRTSRRSA